MSNFDSPMHVSFALDWLGRAVGGCPKLWVQAGNLETVLLADTDTAIEKPVYICGLARAGSTILLEMLASQPGVVTHRYQDFPFLFTPYWWNMLLKLIPIRSKKKHERAHGDGILVNSESPEAMEEMLWMAFFPQMHSGQPETLDSSTHNPAFVKFYRAHIQKLLLVRKGQRYISKGNYNVTRMPYLQSLFPDARFIVPIREPAAHIVSLMRQHDRFSQAGKKDPRVVRHMSLTGHFEFGLNRTPIHIADEQRMQEITEAWQRGEEIRGWALYWDAIYRFVYDQLLANPQLRACTRIVHFEDLCTEPQNTLKTLFTHANLVVEDKEIDTMAATIHAPDYYPSPLSNADLTLIRDITGKTYDTVRKIGACA